VACQPVEDLRYQTQSSQDTKLGGKGEEYAFVKIRYKLPKSDTSTLIATPVDGRQERRKLEEIP
jgi:Ca-activated chloride channel family protein